MAQRRSSSCEIEAVRLLITRIRAEQRPDPIALTEAQERGFGLLMSMEAELQRATRAARDVADSPAAAGEAQARVRELRDALAELSDALTELREISCTRDGPSKVGYGFVLPATALSRAGKPAGY